MPGQWIGPYQFAQMDTAGETSLAEIAHAALRPPAVGEGLSGPRVILWCRQRSDQEDYEQFWTQSRTFVWSPRTPSSVTEIPFAPEQPGANMDPTHDIFCAGHTFLPDGSLITVGGLNHKERWTEFPAPTCAFTAQKPFGHKGVFRLDTSVDPPVWSAPYGSNVDVLARERYYPTAITLSDGQVFVGGHIGEPGNDCPPVYSPLLSARVREILAPLTVGLSGPIANYREIGDCDPAAPTSETLSLWDYPRMHLLRSGMIFQSNARTGGHQGTPQAAFLDVENPTCENSGFFPEERWEYHDDDDIARRDGGSSVHLITRDANDVAHEVVYVVGGQDGEGEQECCADTYDSVQKMVDPSPLLTPMMFPETPWVEAPSLNKSRSNHNTVILLDGSLLVVGGNQITGPYPSPCSATSGGTCTSHLEAEMYRPPEVFGPGYDTDPWHIVASATVRRRYHSVAGLLPDGTVFSAGGFEPASGPDPAHHSLEVYQPWYHYESLRPKIEVWPDPLLGDEVGYRTDAFPEDIFIEVDFKSPAINHKRVALLKPGSVTHAFDSDQRYVELHVIESAPTMDPNIVILRVRPPQDGYEAPPGYYMLTVINSCNTPSPARWIRVASQD